MLTKLFLDNLLLAVLDVNAVSRNVLYFLTAEIIGGFVSRAIVVYRADCRTGVVFCERKALSIVGLDLQCCCTEFFNDEVQSKVIVVNDMQFVVI